MFESLRPDHDIHIKSQTLTRCLAFLFRAFFHSWLRAMAAVLILRWKIGLIASWVQTLSLRLPVPNDSRPAQGRGIPTSTASAGGGVALLASCFSRSLTKAPSRWGAAMMPASSKRM